MPSSTDAFRRSIVALDGISEGLLRCPATRCADEETTGPVGDVVSSSCRNALPAGGLLGRPLRWHIITSALGQKVVDHCGGQSLLEPRRFPHGFQQN